MDDPLLQYLPEVFGEDPATRDFLRAFGKILLGGVDEFRGLEQIIQDLPRTFTPGNDATDGAPDKFLPWLGQWVALSLRTDITQDSVNDNALRRRFIANMVRLYRKRGTLNSMKELLGIFTGTGVTVDDQVDGEPHFFKVLLDLEALKTSNDQKAFERIKEVAHSVIRLEKPAHTRYLLIPAVKTMQIGRRQPPTKYFILVGENTRLGTTPRTQTS